MKYPYTENIEVLLNNEANVDSVTDSGMTALMWASSFGYLEIVDLLVKKGANIESVDNNDRTAL